MKKIDDIFDDAIEAVCGHIPPIDFMVLSDPTEDDGGLGRADFEKIREWEEADIGPDVMPNGNAMYEAERQRRAAIYAQQMEETGDEIEYLERHDYSGGGLGAMAKVLGKDLTKYDD